MKARVRTIEQWRSDQRQWHEWFAWYPVRIGKHLYWLTTVDRKGCGEPADDNFWSHRVKA